MLLMSEKWMGDIATNISYLSLSAFSTIVAVVFVVVTVVFVVPAPYRRSLSHSAVNAILLVLRAYALPTALTVLSVPGRYQGRKGVSTSQDAGPLTYDVPNTYSFPTLSYKGHPDLAGRRATFSFSEFIGCRH